MCLAVVRAKLPSPLRNAWERADGRFAVGWVTRGSSTRSMVPKNTQKHKQRVGGFRWEVERRRHVGYKPSMEDEGSTNWKANREGTSGEQNCVGFFI